MLELAHHGEHRAADASTFSPFVSNKGQLIFFLAHNPILTLCGFIHVFQTDFRTAKLVTNYN
jgi:hypothetical protein